MLSQKELYIIVPSLIDTINSNREYLSDIDGQIGDGDHGINMSKGFSICSERLDPVEDDLSAALQKLADVLMMEIGGSMGPLYGMFFEGMASACKDNEFITLQIFAEMIQQGLNGIEETGDAKKGDKTLLDSLIPAKDSLLISIENDEEFEAALLKFKIAAEEGKESTREMVAKVGRASRLGERSRGVLDPGATSCNLILQTIADTILTAMGSQN
jgi:dihydroxyacetone kinase-like protein